MKKKWLIYISICSAVLFFGSCQKFLDVKPQAQQGSVVDATTTLNEITGAYNALITPDPTRSEFGSYDVHGVYFITVTNIMSDDADKGSYPADQPLATDIDNFTLDSRNGFVAGLWKGYYAGVSRTNVALNAINSNASFFSVAKVAGYSAEMRFLRAYFYFNLVRMFGGVPKILTVPSGPTNQDSSFYKRVPAQTIYDSVIIPDLLFAVHNLPLKSQTDIGRATKGAAEALLAKVDMYQQNWQQCDSLTTDIVNSGQYSLVPDYSILWRQAGDNSNESVFEVETGIYANADYGIPGYVEYQGARQDNGQGISTTPWNNPGFNQPNGDDGFGFCTPTANLVAAYEPGDKRLAASIIQLPAGGPPDTLWDGFTIPTIQTTVNYNYKAYHSKRADQLYEVFKGDRGNCQKNLHILRYAEVLLIQAEARLHTGGDAATPLNTVRERAGLPDATTVDMNAVWKERRVELAMEHDRFWDLVRQGRAAQVMQASGKTNFVAGKNELLPIPFAEIQASGGQLTQNNGY